MDKYGEYVLPGYIAWVKIHPIHVYMNRRGYWVEYQVRCVLNELGHFSDTLGLDGLGLEW